MQLYSFIVMNRYETSDQGPFPSRLRVYPSMVETGKRAFPVDLYRGKTREWGVVMWLEDICLEAWTCGLCRLKPPRRGSSVTWVPASVQGPLITGLRCVICSKAQIPRNIRASLYMVNNSLQCVFQLMSYHLHNFTSSCYLDLSIHITTLYRGLI